MKQWLLNIAIWFDQGANVFLGGSPDETLSARAWRNRERHSAWVWIDTLFFWQDHHCKSSYEAEMSRKQMPLEYR